MNRLLIRDEYIRLCDALKLSGEADTGGMAKMMILAGDVQVNGEVCLQKGKKLYPGDRFTFGGLEYLIVQ
ncbi:MAG: RNA-binding S4 domain-containing protein [Clostridia bacterium]|nr:RNA-binding S4 domain-containing protein [Clostridia bacterium]